MRKTNTGLIRYIPPVFMGDTQEEWVTAPPPSGPSHQLKYHLQIKTKEDVMASGEGGASYRRLSVKHSKQG